MNGPEHYKEAEEDLGRAQNAPVGSPDESYFLMRAQVHATLAQVAAQAHTALCSDSMTEPEAKTWYGAIQ